jgi:protein subunit release factor A
VLLLSPSSNSIACRAKLHEAELQKQAASLSAQRRAVAGLANANERIRSYNYQEGRVSDHRVGVTLQVSRLGVKVGLCV